MGNFPGIGNHFGLAAVYISVGWIRSRFILLRAGPQKMIYGDMVTKTKGSPNLKL